MKSTTSENSQSFSRRTWLATSGVAALGLGAVAWDRFGREAQPCFIARNRNYDQDLTEVITDGLCASGLNKDLLRGKRVLLKPNMVEPSRFMPHMTTHPAVVAAAVEVFRRWGCIVKVGEAPGHVRDTEMALRESDISHALSQTQADFADLNYEPTVWCKNRGRKSSLKGFYFPRSVLEADLIVSMPKMKTHHWMGITAGLKNMYGVIPGSRYGWPKNVLHHNGIPETVYDINASIAKTITIVDGIDCMEGDGPIMGTCKHMGLIVIGCNLVAVDSTLCRIMGFAPEKVPYLRLAQRRLGRTEDWAIKQIGEDWQTVADPFGFVQQPHLIEMRASPQVYVT